MLEACPFAVVALTREQTVLLWIGAAEEMFGWTSDEMLEKQLPIIPEGGEANFTLLVEAQMQGIAIKGQELTTRRKDGAVLQIKLWTSPLKDETGRIFGSLSIMTDITSQKMAAFEQPQVLVNSEQAEPHSGADRFRELLEAAPDGIIEVDAAGRIVLMNTSTERMFGYSRQELLGKCVDDLIPEHARARHANHRATYGDHPHVRPMGTGLQLLARRKDGAEFPVEISLSPISSTKGLRISAIIRDVSERKKHEEQLNRTRTQFTEELARTNRELELRNKEIARANQLKDEFLASISHELRTPLHTIVGFSQLLSEASDDELSSKQRRFVGHIQRDSLHLLSLINDILDLSAVEAGKLSLHPELFDTGEAIEEVLSSIASLASSKSIVVSHLCKGSFVLEADRTRFTQIFYNLLSNAIKFTDVGGEISVDCRETGTEAEFVVSDNGIGIAEHEQAAIFDKFYQSGATTKGVREGTGLGLAITKQIVELQGGRIWVRSRKGAGSDFHFTLPFVAK